MKRWLLGALLALVLPAISVYAQGMRGGGSRGVEGGGGHDAAGSYHGGYGHGGTAFHSGFGGRVGVAHGGGFHGGYHGVYHGGYGRGHGRGYHDHYGHGYGGAVIVYGYGVPYYYPYYASPYYCAPAYGYYDTQPGVTYVAPSDYPPDQAPDAAADDNSQAATYTAQDAQGYYAVGDQWGSGMKQYKLTMDQLVTYLKAYIVNASPAQQDAFRSGFIASAIPNAAATFDQAMQQAAPSQS